MWVIKIILPYTEISLLSRLAKKYKVSMVGYPISGNISEKENCVHVIISGFLVGESKDIKDMMDEARKEKKVMNLDFKDNFVTVHLKMHIANKYLFQPGIFHTKPVVMDKNGDYTFELGSWDKKKLAQIEGIYNKLFNAKLIYIKEKKDASIQTINIYPKLTDKQKKCFQTAINNHYYDFPRKITLKELAKKVKLSYSTYQFHLQNAEKKMIPFLNSLI